MAKPKTLIVTPQKTAFVHPETVVVKVESSDSTKYDYKGIISDSDDNNVADNLSEISSTPGLFQFTDSTDLEPGLYTITVRELEKGTTRELSKGTASVTVELVFTAKADNSSVTEGDPVLLSVEITGAPQRLVTRNIAAYPAGPFGFDWQLQNVKADPQKSMQWKWDTTGLSPNSYDAVVVASNDKGDVVGQQNAGPINIKARGVKQGDVFPVMLRRTASESTDDQALWAAIRSRCDAIGFPRYNQFIESVFCGDNVDHIFENTRSALRGTLNGEPIDTRLSLNSVDAYNVLRLATEVFLLLESGVVLKSNNTLFVPTGDDFAREAEDLERFNDNISGSIQTKLATYLGADNKLPYFERILSALIGLDRGRREEKLPYCDGILKYRFSSPSLVELIWSYWHEEGMLVQTMNAIAMRFQNRRGPAARDPLAELAIDPLRPLNNLLWGYIQNEQHRLSVPRRAYEYDSQYGISLVGKAVPKLRSADSRSKFLEAFHVLLNKAAQFYREDSDTTVIADAFPLLKAIREVHLILAEGAHNQFGDLPWTARVEMMVEQWLLARPEMGEFIRGRAMVPYREDWMGRVDAMKKLQGWSDTTITQFQEMAMYGEQVILSIRYGDWIVVNNEDQAKNWARYWKPEIQAYIHAYRAATGVDLNLEPVDCKPPSHHLRRLEQKKLASLW